MPWGSRGAAGRGAACDEQLGRGEGGVASARSGIRAATISTQRPNLRVRIMELTGYGINGLLG